MKTITIEFLPDGTVRLEADGFTGGECLQATAPYEKALGMTSENSTRKMKTALPKKEGMQHANRHRVQTRR